MKFFSFGYNGVLVCRLSFRAGIYGTKTGMFSRKIILLFLIARPRVLQRRFAAKRAGFGAEPHNSFVALTHSQKMQQLTAAVRRLLTFCNKHTFIVDILNLMR